MHRRFLVSLSSLIASLAISLLWHHSANAQSPGKPIRLLVNGAAGSVGDLLARPLSESLAKALGAPVIVENRPGAGSFLSVAELLRSPADGQTLMMISAAQVVWNQHLFQKLPYDPDVDFIPISSVAAIPLMLVVNPSIPARSVESFIALAKGSPKKFSFGVGGVGNAAHISFERFQNTAGIDMIPVSYKSGPAALQDLIGGQIDAMLDGVPLLEPHVKSGRLRALAVATKRRLQSMPDVPTLAESGYPDFEAVIWVGLAVKRGTPPALIAKLNEETNRALSSPLVREAYGRIGAEVRGSSSRDFSSFIKREQQVWSPILQKANIKID